MTSPARRSDSDLPRFQQASRRAFLARLAGVGALAAAPALLAACGSSADSTVLGGAATTAGSGAGSTTAGSATTGAASGSTAAGSGKGTIAFGYSGSGKNPYVAVFIENASGALVKTVAVWYLAQKNPSWLADLSTWYPLASSRLSSLSAVTSGTRAPGSYSLTWDGTDDSGQALAAGAYTLFIEGAREHGSHSLTSAKFTFGKPATVPIPAGGQITAGTLTLA